MARETIATRQITNVVPKGDSILSGAASTLNSFVKEAYKTSENSKIVNNYSKAQLEINDLTKKYRVQNASDPQSNKENYEYDVKSILDKYGSDIGSGFKTKWAAQSNNLINKTRVSNQAWEFEQNASNSLMNFEDSKQNNYDIAFQNGVAFGGGDGEIESVLDFSKSREDLKGLLAESFDESSIETELKDYDTNYTTNFITGIAQTDPNRAEELLKDKKVYENLDAASFKKVDKEIKRQQGIYQQRLVDNYKNGVDVQFRDNPFKFEEESKKFNDNPVEMQKALGVDRKTYDKMKSYNNTLKKTYDDLNQKTNPNTGSLYSEEEIARVSNLTSAATTSYDLLNLGTVTKKGESKTAIKNPEYNNFGSVLDVRSQMQNSVNEGGKIDSFNNKMSKTSAALVEMMREKQDTGFSVFGVPISKANTEEKLSSLVMQDMEGADSLKADVFENVYNRMIDEGIPYNSTNGNNLDRIETMYKEEKYRTLKNVHPKAFESPAEYILGRGRMQTFSDKPDLTVGAVIDNFGGYEKAKVGVKSFDILRDKQGNIIDARESLDDR